MPSIYADEREGVKDEEDALAAQRLLERAPDEDLDELVAILGACERVRRRTGVLGCALRRFRGIGATGELLLDACGVHRPVGHVRERHGGPRAGRRERRDSDERPVLRASVELQVAPT